MLHDSIIIQVLQHFSMDRSHFIKEYSSVPKNPSSIDLGI